MVSGTADAVDDPQSANDAETDAARKSRRGEGWAEYHDVGVFRDQVVWLKQLAFRSEFPGKTADSSASQWFPAKI